jgi:hypothetical protein
MFRPRGHIDRPYKLCYVKEAKPTRNDESLAVIVATRWVKRYTVINGKTGFCFSQGTIIVTWFGLYVWTTVVWTALFFCPGMRLIIILQCIFVCSAVLTLLQQNTKVQQQCYQSLPLGTILSQLHSSPIFTICLPNIHILSHRPFQVAILMSFKRFFGLSRESVKFWGICKSFLQRRVAALTHQRPKLEHRGLCITPDVLSISIFYF